MQKMKRLINLFCQLFIAAQPEHWPTQSKQVLLRASVVERDTVSSHLIPAVMIFLFIFPSKLCFLWNVAEYEKKSVKMYQLQYRR